MRACIDYDVLFIRGLVSCVSAVAHWHFGKHVMLNVYYFLLPKDTYKILYGMYLRTFISAVLFQFEIL